MIQFYGDVHRSFDELEAMIAQASDDVRVHIQLGDLGIWPREGMPPGTRDLAPAAPLYFIDGNWDYFPWLRGHSEPVELLPNVIYVPRGTILDLDGRRVAFLGGAESISRYRRTAGINWWPSEERIQPSDIEPFRGQRADILVTHMPPAVAVRRCFGYGSRQPKFHGHVSSLSDALGDAWNQERAPRDSYCSVLVEKAWDLLGRPIVVSGHLHRSARYDDLGVHILNELETLRL